MLEVCRCHEAENENALFSNKPFTLGCDIVMVVELVLLTDPESYAGRDFSPWQRNLTGMIRSRGAGLRTEQSLNLDVG